MATDLGSAFGRIVIDTSGASKGIGGLRAQMGAFGRGGALPMVAGLVGVAAGLGHVVSTAAQFDKALSAVGAVSGATGAQMGQLREQALSLGQSTVFSASEVAAAQGELVKAGVSVQQVLGGALQGALSLAAAGELDLGQAATIAANAMNLFGLEGKDVGHIADALATAANTTTADVADFGVALTQGGSAAKAAGLTFDDTTTILEALATSGVKNSDAGTSMKNALIQVLSPTKRAAAAMAAHNLVLTDAQGNFVNAAEASRRLRTATEGMTAAQRVNFLSTIAGTDGFRTLLALIDTGPKRLAAMRTGLDREGSAAETARKRQNNLAGDLEQLSGALETAEIRAGEFAQSGLRQLAQAATGVLTAVSQPGALEGFVDRLDIGDAAASAWDGLSSAVGALEPVALGAGAAVLGAVHAVAGIVDAGGSALSALTPLISVLATGVEVAGALVGAVASLGGAFASSAVGTAILTTAALALAGAYVGLKVVAVAAAIAVRAAAFAETAIVFAQLATEVRSAAGALALLQTAAVGSKVLGALASPVGLAAAGVTLLAAGVAVLASGMFRTVEPATDLEGALKAVDSAARDAAGSVSAMNSQVDKLQDAHSRAARAALAVEGAEKNYAATVADAGAKSLEAREAAQRLADARTELTRATRDERKAEQTAATQAAELATKMAGLVIANENATGTAELLQKVAAQLGPALSDGGKGAADAAAHIKDLEQAGASAETRTAALQRAFLNAAVAIKGTGPAAQAAKVQLLTLASLSVGGLKTFVADVKAGTDKGESKAKATKDAIQKALKGADTTVDFSAFLAAINRGGAAGERAMLGWAAKIRAAERAAAPTAHGSPSAVEVMQAGMRELESTVDAGARRVSARVAGFARDTHRGWEDAASSLGDARAIIDTQLAAIDQAESILERRRDARFALQQARSRLARATSAEDVKQAKADVQAQIAASRELERQIAQEAADRRRIAALKAAPLAKAALLDKMDTIMSDAEAAGRDLAEKVGNALETAFATQAKAIDASLARELKAIDLTLSNSMAQIDRTLEATQTAIDQAGNLTGKALDLGVTVDLSGVENLGPALRQALEGVASDVAFGMASIAAGEQQQLAQVVSATASVLGQVNDAEASQLTQIAAATADLMGQLDDALASSLRPIEATLATATANITSLQAELDRRSAARTDRQEQATLAEAQATKDATDAEVERLRTILAGTRTDSEREAATRLLTAAMGRQEDAALTLSDAQEAISTTGIERELAAWQASAAESTAAKDTIVANADDARARITANADAQTAAVIANADAAREALAANLEAQTQAITAAADSQRDATMTAARELTASLLDTSRTFATQIAETSRTTATALADQARIVADNAAQAARDALDLRLADVKATLERDLGNLGEALREGNFGAAQQAINGILGVLNSGDVRSALGTSGLVLGQAFAAGLERSTADVVNAAKLLASTTADYLQLRSPARRGPLSFDFRRSGLAIGGDIARGLRVSGQNVRAEALRLAASAAVGARGGVADAGGLAGAGAVGGGGVTQHNTFNVQRPVEDVRVWSQRAMFEARLAGGRL